MRFQINVKGFFFRHTVVDDKGCGYGFVDVVDNQFRFVHFSFNHLQSAGGTQGYLMRVAEKFQLFQKIGSGYCSTQIGIDTAGNLIVGNGSFYDVVVVGLLFPFIRTVKHNEIEPFFAIIVETERI